MKKFIVGGLVLSMLLTVGTASLAATDISGNLRFWLKSDREYNDISKQYEDRETYFQFDRLELVFDTVLDEKSGVNSKVSFRKPGKNNEEDSDIRLTYGYYYQKNVFSAKDTLYLGYVESPFEAGNYLSYWGGLEGYLDPCESVGVRYDLTMGDFEFKTNVVNANNQSKDYNLDTEDVTGIDIIFRCNYAGVKDWTFGAVYAHDKTKDYINKYYIADATYANGPFGAYFEYLTADNGNDTESGFFGEVNYQITKALAVYVDVTTNADKLESGMYDDPITEDNLYAAGCTYYLTEKSYFLAEYMPEYTDGAGNVFGVRFRVNF